MNSEVIPTYHIQYIFGQQLKGPNSVLIGKREMIPATTTLPEIVMKKLELIGNYYVVNSREFIKPIKTTVTFSIKDGISVSNCTDQRMLKIIESWQEYVAIPEKEAKERGFFNKIKHREGSLEDRKTAESQIGGKALFVDALAYELYQKYIDNPVKVTLELSGCLSSGKPGGSTTNTLRFPHMLRDLSLRFEEKRMSEHLRVCIVGPGLKGEDNNMQSPQFVELYSLFPNANFLLLDNDQKTLQMMNRYFKACKFAIYDPAMLRLRSLKVKGDNLYLPEKFQGLLRIMKETFNQKAISPKNVDEMWKLGGKVERLVLKVDPEKIQPVEFDINTSQMDALKKDGFEVIVATFSIGNALEAALLNNSKFDFVGVFEKFLASLKENGSFYIETPSIKLFMELNSGKRGMDVCLRYLEGKIGYKLKIEEIPLSDLLANDVGLTNRIPTRSLNEEKGTISTTSITVITKSSEKVVLSSDEKAKNDMEFVLLLEKFEFTGIQET